MHLSISLVLLALSAASYQGELKEHLGLPVKATLQSAKHAYDLEICVADVLTLFGTPVVLRNGPDDVVIAASIPSASTYMASATIIREGKGSRIEMRVRGRGWDDRLQGRLEGCA